jgi:hypothetical protein
MPWPLSPSSAAIQITKHGFDDTALEAVDGKFIYYMKPNGTGSTSIWRVPAQGGEETQVLPSILHNNFAVAGHGIYFIPDSRPYAVQFLNFATGKVAGIARLPREPAWGLSASPDGWSLLYTEFRAVRSDLMLVENFR